MSTIAEKLKAKQERLVSIKDRLTHIKGLIEADDEEVSAEMLSEVDTLTADEEGVIKSIESLQKIESGLASKAAPVAPGAIKHRDNMKSGDREDHKDVLFKMATANLIAHVSKSRPDEVAASIYGGDDRMAAVMKAAVAPADTQTAGWAAELVQQSYGAFLDEMRGVSVFAALRAQTMSLDFNGQGSIKIPRRDLSGTHGTDMAGAWVGELGVIPVKKLALTSQTLSENKVAVISAMSSEIMNQSVPALEQIVRQAMIDDTAEALDSSLLDNVAAAAGIRPAGLLHGVTGTASSGATSSNIITDIRTLLTALTNANLGSQPILIMNTQRLLGLSTVTNAVGQFAFRDEIASGRLLGVPVIASSHVPTGTIVAVDGNSFVSASGAPMFKVSDQAVLTMADAGAAAPSQAGDKNDFMGGDLGTAEQVPPKGGIIVNGTGTAAPAGTAVANYQAMSMYQQDAVAIRMIMPLGWGLIRTGSVASITGAAW